MTHTGSWSGSVNADTAEERRELEKQLHDEIAAVLRRPEYGTATSSFAGTHVRSNALHTSEEESDLQVETLPGDTQNAGHTESLGSDREHRGGERNRF